MQQKEWLYYLVDQQGRTYEIENGILVAKHNAKPLKYTPDGWQDISIAWERDMTTWGINRNFGLAFGFVLDGSDILRQLFFTKTPDEILYLLIKRQQLFISDTEYYFWYKYFSRSEIDMSEAVIEDGRIEVPLIEGGLLKEYQANKDTSYEIAIDELSPIVVKMDGLKLRSTANAPIVPDFDIDYSTFPSGSIILPMAFVETDGVAPGVTFLSQNIEAARPYDGGDEYEYYRTSGNWFCSNDNADPVAFKFSGVLSIECITNEINAGFNIRFMKNTSTSSNQAEWEIQPVVILDPGEIRTFEFNIDITLQPKEKLFLKMFITTGVSSTLASFRFLKNSFVNAQADSIYRTTYIKAVSSFLLYYELVRRITGSPIHAESSLLNSMRNIVLTSGDAIRGLENPKIKTKLSDYIKSLDAIKGIGFGIENNKMVLEKKSYFFDSTNPIHLGRVSQLKYKRAKNMMFNNIKIGYPDQEYKDVNGREEFNTTQEWSTDVKKIVKSLDLISVYRADPFGIEYTRMNLTGKKSTDSENDNDIFFLNIDFDNPKTFEEDTDGFFAGSTYYELKRETYNVIEGLTHPEFIFNIEELTPKRMLLEHSDFLASFLYGYEGTNLKYQTSQKNRSLRTTKTPSISTPITVDEDSEVPVEALGPGFAKPYIFEFFPEGSIDLVELLEENPNRCFSFETPDGHILKGYNLKIGIQPDSKEAQAFQLLSTYDNDLTKLKNG